MAIPRGLAFFGSLSATAGKPAESENRTVTGVASPCACGARVNELAAGDGLKVPVSMMPLACAGRKPGCTPFRLSSAWIRSRLRPCTFPSVGGVMNRVYPVLCVLYLGRAAVDKQFDPGDVTAVVGSEENRGFRDFIRGAEASHWNSGQQTVSELPFLF